MGTCFSYSETRFVPNEGIPGQDNIALGVLKQLMLSDYDINKFYTAYLDIDADASGYIRADEFRAYFKIEGTSFNNKLFGSFDADGNGFLNFLEFVTSMWDFLSTDSEEIGGFCFHLLSHKNYCSEHNITPSQVKEIMELIHGKNYIRNKGLKKLIDQMLSTNATISSMEDFVSWSHENPVLVSPILKLQLTLRQEIMGSEFWQEMAAKRKASRDARRPGYVVELTAHAIEKYEKMAAALENEKSSKEAMERNKRRGSIARLVDKARRLSKAAFRKNAPVETERKPRVKKPLEKRGRRSFVKPKLKIEKKKKDIVNSTRTAHQFKSNAPLGLYNIMFNQVIVVDDEMEKGKKSQSTLEEMMIASSVSLCYVGSDALKLVESSLRENKLIECVFVDGAMPVQNGPTVASKLRSMGYLGIIVGICEDGDQIDRNEFLGNGANLILNKPLDTVHTREALVQLTPAFAALIENRNNNRLS